MVRRILLFFIVLSPLNGTFAQTLEEAVVATLRTNPDILAGKHNVEAALQLRRQAKGAYLPSVDLVVAGGEEISNNTTTRAARPNVG
ncbi:MAG TPA: TolC family protein, partial [Pseudomonadales bacterium]|nr:TolC family protein [Pseudomonadales bacterium]